MGHWMRGVGSIFDSADLTPHGFCLLWRPELIWLHVISDTAIGIAYYSIPLALAYFVWRRKDLAFGWVFWLFAVFILACGTTHWFEVWTLWHPDYGVQGAIKGFTALSSAITALILWPLVPQALALPSPTALRRVNDELSQQIRERNSALQRLEHEMAERRRTEEILRQAQKMEAVGQLTGGIAHDFNNLLTVIIGNLDTLRHDLAGQDEHLQRAAATALRGATRAATLTKRLLAFSRQQPLDPRAVDVNQLVSSMSDMIRRTLGETIESKMILAAGLVPSICDPNQLESALLNLVINARDAVPSGGNLTIETANVVLDAEIVDGEAVEPGPYVMLAVSDDGVGMSREVLLRAAEPFFTTKEFGKGSGLGLSMVYGFIKQSRGHLRIDSAPGRGTSVKLFLPCASGAVEWAAAASDAPAPSAEAADRLILVVEDDDEVRRYSMGALEQLGYRVVGAADGDAALRLLDGDRSIALLFTDIGLPGRDGRNLAAEARRRRPDLKVLFTTGYDAGVNVRGELHNPGDPIIDKPFTVGDLAREIGQVIGAAT